MILCNKKAYRLSHRKFSRLHLIKVAKIIKHCHLFNQVHETVLQLQEEEKEKEAVVQMHAARAPNSIHLIGKQSNKTGLGHGRIWRYHGFAVLVK